MAGEDRQTVAGAYALMHAHEELCAERYKGINEKLGWVLGGFGILILSLLGWAFIQLYTLEPLRIAAAHQASRTSVDVSVSQPPAKVP